MAASIENDDDDKLIALYHRNDAELTEANLSNQSCSGNDDSFIVEEDSSIKELQAKGVSIANGIDVIQNLHMLPKAPAIGKRFVAVSRLLVAPPPRNLFGPEMDLVSEDNDKLLFKKFAVLESGDGNEKVYKCILCSLKRKTREALLCHLLQEHDDGTTKTCRKMSCPCGFKSLNKHSLRQHVKRCANPYSCNLCPYVSIRSGDVKRHMATHCVSKYKFSCTNCEMKFKSKSSLSRHGRESSCHK